MRSRSLLAAAALLFLTACAEQRTPTPTAPQAVAGSLTGIVTDAAQPGSAIAGARVEVATGSLKGLSTTTNDRGEYTLTNLQGELDLVVTLEGFETKTLHAAILPGPTRLDIALVVEVPFDQRQFTGRLCTIVPPFPSQQECRSAGVPYPLDAQHVVNVARPTSLNISLSYDYVGDYYPNSMDLRVACGDDVVFSAHIDDLTAERTVDLPRPCAYAIRLSNYVADRKGGSWTTYRLATRFRR